MEPTGIEKHRYCNRNERAEWIMRYRSSGLCPAQFAEQHGLKLGTLRNWSQKEGIRSSLGKATTWLKNGWAAHLGWTETHRFRNSTDPTECPCRWGNELVLPPLIYTTEG